MNIESLIDHTILKADATESEVLKICEEAKQYKFASVCVNPFYVKLVSEQLQDTGIDTTSVVGFPLGASISEIKAFETRKAIEDGASEIDMVINIGALKDRDLDIVREDITDVVSEADGKVVKVIIEACLLTDKEKIIACELAKECGANFVKTSTGFSTSGATVEDVRLMRKTVGSDMGVKASGGIRTLEDLKAMVDAGATRIGASASVAIIEQSKK